MDMKYSGEQLDWEDVLSNCCEEGQQIGANGLSVRSVNTCWSPALHDGSVAIISAGDATASFDSRFDSMRSNFFKSASHRRLSFLK